MLIKCIAIDDEPLALKLISGYVARFPFLQLVNTFEDAISGAEFLNTAPIDLLSLTSICLISRVSTWCARLM